MLGTFHGLGPKYLQTYLAQFIYRFNRRHLEHELFDQLLGACVWRPILRLPILLTRVEFPASPSCATTALTAERLGCRTKARLVGNQPSKSLRPSSVDIAHHAVAVGVRTVRGRVTVID